MTEALSQTIAEGFAPLNRDAPIAAGADARMRTTFLRAPNPVSPARRLSPGTEFLKAVHFTHGEPPYRAEYDRIFRIPIVFGSDRNAVPTDAA